MIAGDFNCEQKQIDKVNKDVAGREKYKIVPFTGESKPATVALVQNESASFSSLEPPDKNLQK